MSKGQENDPVVALGIMGPGRKLYDSYRSQWAVYKHPLPEWGHLNWEALHCWNKAAIEAAEASPHVSGLSDNRKGRK